MSIPKLVPESQLINYGIDLSNRHRKRLEDEGSFPKRIMITPKSHAYLECEIAAFLVDRIADARGYFPAEATATPQ